MARHRFFTLSPEPLCSVRFNGYFQRVNPAFVESLGFDEKAARKLAFLELVNPPWRGAAASTSAR